MVAKITAMILGAVKWLVTTVAGKAVIKVIAKVSFMGFFLLALAGAGLLPYSPFSYAITPIRAMMYQIPYIRYVAFFIPFVEIITIALIWLWAVMAFHVLKITLRIGGVIK